MPCDGSLEVLATPAGVPPDTPCAVELMAGESARVRRLELTDGSASFTIGPGKREYRARLRCEGFAPSPWRPLTEDDEGRAELGVVALAAAPPESAPAAP